MVPHTPPFVDGDLSLENRVTAEWLNWVNERVTDTERFLGFYDASTGNLPQVEYPLAIFLPGDNYEISVQGTLDVFDPVTLLQAPTLVNVGDFIRWVYGSPTNPDGWYRVVPTLVTQAVNVQYTPSGGLTAVEVQAALDELEANKLDTVDLLAVNVVSTPYGGIAAINVQAALDELEDEKADVTAETALGTSFTPTGLITATDVQNALEELATYIGGGGGSAFGTTFVPYGNISATNVQDAIQELDDDKVAKAGDTMTGNLNGPITSFDQYYVGRFVGPGAGNFSLYADGTGALEIADDVLFSLTLDGAGSILTSALAVGGSSAPNANASLDIQGIKPMLLPRLTTAQRNAVTAAEGMLVFDTDLDTVYQYTGAAWSTFGGTTPPASSVVFTPYGSIAATTVQAALQELDDETVKKTSGTGSALLPAGTTAQRDGSPTTGATRWNSTLSIWEGWNGSAWAVFGTTGKQVTSICMAVSDEMTALTTGTAKITFRMPHAMTLTAVRASLTTAQASGSIFTVDINEGGTTILSTKLTIDNTELTSTTAATPAVISDTALADDASITVDIDQIGTSGAAGLKIYLIGTI